MATRVSTSGTVIMPRIQDVLRTPEDLEKVATLKAEINRKKADVDARLREGLQDHLETIRNGVSITHRMKRARRISPFFFCNRLSVIHPTLYIGV